MSWHYLLCRCTYHVEADDLTVGLLDLLELGEEVPEARLGNNCVGSKDAHAVQLGGRVCLGGQVAPDDLVLVETACIMSVVVPVAIDPHCSISTARFSLVISLSQLEQS